MRPSFAWTMLLVTLSWLPLTSQIAFDAPSIPLRAGTGTGIITMRRASSGLSDNLPLSLRPGPVIDSGTEAIVPGAAVALKAIGGTDELPTDLGSNQTLMLEAAISGDAKSLASHVQIFNGQSPIGVLSAYASDASLDIAIDGEGVADKPLAYTYANPVAINLKNAGAEAYALHWAFEIGNKREAFGDLLVPHTGNARIQFTPKRQSFSFLDWFHPSPKQGLLTLVAHGPSDVPVNFLPQRSIPVSIIMQPLTPFWSSFWSYAYVVFLLLIGGLFSFLGSSMLPNMQKKGDLRARVQELANRTSTVSTRIDSYLRVLLRLERNRISSLISDAPAWIPASADPLIAASSLIETLTKRLSAAERLDELRRRHSQISSTAPPSVTDAIDAFLQAAADELHSASLSDSDLAAANNLFIKAQSSFDLLEDSDALAKQIAGSVTVAIARINKFPKEYYSDLAARLPGVFIIANESRGYSDSKNIVRPMLFAIDHGVAAIHLVLDYAMVRASIPVNLNSSAPSASTAPADLGEIARSRLLEREGKLIELLGTLSWRALRDASLLIQEMREDTYEEDVLDEIAKSGQAEISFDTQQVRPYQPIFFSVQFKNSRFNDAAALQRLLCRWSFPSDPDECTWKVCHYSSGARETPFFRFGSVASQSCKSVEISATVRGQQLDESREVPTPPLKRTIQVQRAPVRERSRFWAEFLQFAIAFSVALAGLLSGALDQLNKLDLIPASIAIIGLGFSASAIKNLLTQSAGQPTATSSGKS